jgi:very-short-patch-repair endonuclease
VSELVSFARALRTESTDVERLLWRHLRAKRFAGYKFRRQQPIGPYIADFVCFDTKLVVEVDGGQHADQRAQDAERDAWLRRQGFDVLRFWNNDVVRDLDAVLSVILEKLSRMPDGSPSPSMGEQPCWKSSDFRAPRGVVFDHGVHDGQ